jgi:hypothetical protein
MLQLNSEFVTVACQSLIIYLYDTWESNQVKIIEVALYRQRTKLCTWIVFNFYNDFNQFANINKYCRLLTKIFFQNKRDNCGTQTK